MSKPRKAENLWRPSRDPAQDNPDVAAERFRNDQAALAEAEQADTDGDDEHAQMLRRIIGD